MQLFITICYQPILNLMIFFYNFVGDTGIAIILVTVVLKLILFPLSLKSLKSQKALQTLQPKIEELKREYKDDKQALSAEIMKLYQNEKINPMSSCFPLLIQLPFLIAVYRVFINIMDPNNLNLVYSFIPRPEMVNHIAFGFLDLAVASIPLAVLAGIAQFFQTKMLTNKKPEPDVKTGKQVPGSADEGMTAMMNKQMVYFMPIITVVIGATLPSGLTLYWFLTTLLTIGQQKLFLRK